MTSTKESVTYNVNLILHCILRFIFCFFFIIITIFLRPMLSFVRSLLNCQKSVDRLTPLDPASSSHKRSWAYIFFPTEKPQHQLLENMLCHAMIPYIFSKSFWKDKKAKKLMTTAMIWMSWVFGTVKVQFTWSECVRCPWPQKSMV
jgi:hypothetical protein